jgi:hypothetical protein
MALNEELIFGASAQLFKAAASARLPQQQEEDLEGLSGLVVLNRRLANLPNQEARNEYLSLDENIQSTLKQWNPEAAYTTEEQLGVIETVKQRGLKPALEKVVAYGDLLNQPYRTLRVRDQRGLGWKDSWRLAAGGKALFDLERESKVDNYYEPSISKIAKQLSVGRSIGEVAATLETPEDFAAFRSMLEGESIFEEAIKDYDTAKISLGRDVFYKALDIDPGEFGGNRKIFNRLSGAVDLGTQIFFDPLTYIPIAGQAYKASTLGIIKILEQTPGARMESISKAFDNPIHGASVRRLFDTAGPEIQKYARGTAKEQAEAFSVLTRQFGADLPLEAVEQLAKNEVFSSAAARRFLNDVESAETLIQGRQVRMTPILPTYTVFRDVRRKLRNTIVATTGLNKLAPIELTGTGLVTAKELLKQASDAGLDANKITEITNAIKATDTKFGRFARLFEIAPSFRKLEIGYKYNKEGKVIGDNGLRSVKDVVALMRTAGFGRGVADEIGLAWTRATPGERIKMYDGMILAVANGLGLTATPSGRRVIENAFTPLAKQKYISEIPVTKELLNSLDPSLATFIRQTTGVTDEILETGARITIDPSTFGGSLPKAIGEWQLADAVRIPPLHEWQRLALSNKNYLFRSMGNFFNGKISSGLVNAWAALTLLPRLGIRSVLEEAMVFGLVAPIKTIKNTMLYGYKASRSVRRVINTSDSVFGAESLGLPTRMIEALTRKGLTKELREEVKNAPIEGVADAVVRAQLAGRGIPKGSTAKQFADDLKDFVEFGYGRKYWDDIRSRPSQGARIDPLNPLGSDSPQAIARTNGSVAPFNVSLTDEVKDAMAIGSYKEIPVYNDEYYLNLLSEIIKRIEFSPLSTIAIRNLENSKTAIDDMVKYLDSNPEVAARFANAQGAEVIDHRQLAYAIYFSARQPFQKADGSINGALLSRVRLADGKISAENLTLDDLRAFNKADLPPSILGQNYVATPPNMGSVFENFINNGYDWMDRQISTLVREPFFFSNLTAYRNQLRGLQKRKYDKLVANGYSTEAADKISRQWAEVTAEELAAKRTLEYVDNPQVRTNLAWSMRNFARFYRAQEDFYRRAYRVVFKNPGSLVRFRLGAEALDHSGFVYQNDEPTLMGAGGGEKYFIFPADEIITGALSPVTKLLTGKEFVMPMPLEFTGKIKMLTPSLDPDAAVPAFSGPLSGVSMLALERMLPNFMGPIKDNLLQTTLGRYSKNVSWTDVALPSNVRRLVGAFDQDEKDSQFASASRKAMAYYAANGMSLPLDATEAQKYEFRQNLEATAMNIVVTRFFLGLISPVAPQVGFGRDIPGYLKDTGSVNFKSEFNKLVNEIAATGEDDVYNKALERWTKINPGLLAYSIGETDANKIATVKKTKDAANWVKNNKDLVKAFPEGSAYFIPFTGEFGFDEYAFLKREGYIEALPIEDFLKRVQVAEERYTYEQLKKEFDEKIEAAAIPSMKSFYREQWSQAREDYLVDKPLLVEDLETRGSEQQVRNSLEDLRKMIDQGLAPQGELQNKYKKMIEIYDNAELSLSVLTSNTRFQRNQRERIRKGSLQQIEALAAGDPQAEAAVRVLFRRLIGV